ncbi:MAG: hypothetical protein LBH95_08635 [Oscillospiraceae bacterium]|jgi:hypothetical protein|nr:hypothetical protein [Oscillospiraceae bacterium]
MAKSVPEIEMELKELQSKRAHFAMVYSGRKREEMLYMIDCKVDRLEVEKQRLIRMLRK